MAQAIDQEYDNGFNLIEIIVKDNGEYIHFERVRHGRWVEQWNDDYMLYFHFCSECGKDALTKEETMHDEVLSLYCPNCGVKMDGEKHND